METPRSTPARTTSTIWKRSNTRLFEDAALTRGLERWGTQVSPIEASFLLKALIYSTFAVPIEPPTDPNSDETTLRLAKDKNGNFGIAIFTTPKVLMSFAVEQGWTTPDKEVPWSAVPGKDCFLTLCQSEGIECWVNPGSSSLRLNQEAMKALAQGVVPDPRKLGAVVPSMTAAFVRPGAPPQDIQDAVPLLPTRIVVALKITLEQHPVIASAVLYKPPFSPIMLAFKTEGVCPQEQLERAVLMLTKILAGGATHSNVMAITPEIEVALKNRVKPFYEKKM
jgi:hypothetical protein